MADLYIGLMSGTSLDGTDGVVAEIAETGCKVLAHCYLPFSPALMQGLLSLNSPGPNELHRAARYANQLVLTYAQVVNQLVEKSGLRPGQIKAIGAHGQTVRHHPQALQSEAEDWFEGQPTPGYTLQINNPALLAELTGITVVADFRSRDVAAGGQGAPLVPAFHQALFAQAHKRVGVLNIGGISNVSLLGPLSTTTPEVMGFDCGPGNVLMDLWCQQHLGKAYDQDGAWAASGQVCKPLLTQLLNEPYFALPAPRSTGRDLFSPSWLEAHLTQHRHVSVQDVQATLAMLTAQCCADSVLASGGGAIQELLVCGGGAFNAHLMALLQKALPGIEVKTTDAAGLPPMQVEAAAFAWLAARAMTGQTGNLPLITGARGARILGAVYPV
ncbi:MAG: hypothetical protein RLZZ591_2069 [Pseudomonadota bacterium]|jgi:anhydro-N-acetylmuramic acid kinase